MTLAVGPAGLPVVTTCTKSYENLNANARTRSLSGVKQQKKTRISVKDGFRHVS